MLSFCWEAFGISEPKIPFCRNDGQCRATRRETPKRETEPMLKRGSGIQSWTQVRAEACIFHPFRCQKATLEFEIDSIIELVLISNRSIWHLLPISSRRARSKLVMTLRTVRVLWGCIRKKIQMLEPSRETSLRTGTQLVDAKIQSNQLALLEWLGLINCWMKWMPTSILFQGPKAENNVEESISTKSKL